MKRRAFLGTLLAPLVARFIPAPAYDWKTLSSTIIVEAPAGGWVGGITPATYTFWRNNQTADFSHLKEDMRRLFEECR